MITVSQAWVLSEDASGVSLVCGGVQGRDGVEELLGAGLVLMLIRNSPVLDVVAHLSRACFRSSAKWLELAALVPVRESDLEHGDEAFGG